MASEIDYLQLHEKAFVADSHVDTLSRLLADQKVSLGKSSKTGHVDIPKLRRGKVDAAVFALFTRDRNAEPSPAARTLRMIDLAYTLVEEHPRDLAIATCYDDIMRARKAGKIALILSIENGIAIEEHLELLRTYYRLGVRAMGITWHFRNMLGDGVLESRTGSGLTNLGRLVVAEMERLGMLVDVSHLNEKGFWDVLELTSGPVIASHSNAYSVCKHARNLKDDQIKAIADRKGYVGINFCSAFLTSDGNASIADVVRHVRHIASLVGVDLIGIGSDYDGITNPPKGLENASKIPSITRALIRERFGETDIRKLLGKNFLRVFRQVAG